MLLFLEKSYFTLGGSYMLQDDFFFQGQKKCDNELLYLEIL